MGQAGTSKLPPPRSTVYCSVLTPPGHHRFTMTDDKDKGKSRSAGNARQDRLKLALRENLKRRKSQARGRSDANATPRDDAGASPHDEPGRKPGE